MKQEIVLKLEFDAECFVREVKTALEKAVKIVQVEVAQESREAIDSTFDLATGRVTRQVP